jgi:RHS repeat-associated protein
VAAFYAEDHLGSIRDLRMGDGQVQASYDYDPYGAPTRSDETGGVHADYRYAGLVQHAPSGLYLAHYRAYSPTIGRWVSRDPIFEAGGVNLYGYVRNNPLNRMDPLGLSDVTYDSGSGTITVYDNKGNQVEQFPAGNNTTSTSNGPWPNGTFPYSHYVPHPESGPTGPYGSNGNFVFDVPGRFGMGIHSGRSGPQSKTLGCIRTTDDATDFLRNLHQTDPLNTITVK